MYKITGKTYDIREYLKADGGRWRHEAMLAVRNYLEENIPDGTTVIA